jgi:NADH-quinone oxidoreductase subunit H
VLLPAGTIVYLFLFKMMSFMQSRLGPMEAGPVRLDAAPRRGRQVAAEGGHRPRAGRCKVFKVAPLIVLVSTFLLVAWSSLRSRRRTSPTSTPASSTPSRSVDQRARHPDGRLVESANKYSLLGGLRAAGQLIAYELPMVLAVIGVVIQAGTMNLQTIVAAQADGEIFGWDGLGNPYILTQFVGFVVFMIAVQAELTQTPFDMPIAESELVSGYMTEYSGFRFLIFFIAEFATAGVFAAIASVLFLGGWACRSAGSGGRPRRQHRQLDERRAR